MSKRKEDSSEDYIGRAALRFASLPPVKWDKAFHRMKVMYRQDIGRALDDMAVRLARAAAYLGERGNIGCGDSGHQEAVKAQNRAAAKVRKAIGFTYPKDDIHF